MRQCFEQELGRDVDPKAEKKMTDKLSGLWSIINSLIETGFTGSIKFNFNRGVIGRIEKYEEILKK